MNWVVKALKSSVGKKLVMAVTGVLLCLFLVIHLAGNLLMYVGPDVYNGYAHTLHSQPGLIKVAEFGLLILFLVHIWLALETTRDNREARKTRYAVKQSKIYDRKIPHAISPENNMLLTGVVVLAFLLIHVGDFTFNLKMTERIKDLEPFDKAIVIMRNPVSFVAYLVGVLLLGWHLTHGATSMFQSMGLKHPKYDPLTTRFGPFFGLVMAVGFASFPLYAVLTPYQPPAPGSQPAHPHSEQQSDGQEQVQAGERPVLSVVRPFAS